MIVLLISLAHLIYSLQFLQWGTRKYIRHIKSVTSNGCESCWFLFWCLYSHFFLFRYYPHRFAHITPQSQPQIAFKKKNTSNSSNVATLCCGLEAFQCLKLEAGCGSRKQLVKKHQYAIMLKGSNTRFLRSPKLKQMRIQSPIWEWGWGWDLLAETPKVWLKYKAA